MASINEIPVLRGRTARADRTATVFVDDTTLGTLPAVCIKSGAPADGNLRIQHDLARFNPLWLLLILLGPLGWIILAVVAIVGHRRDVLDLRLPMTASMMDAYISARRRLTAAYTLMVVAVFAAPVALVIGTRQRPSASAGIPNLALALLLLGSAALVGFVAHAHIAARRTRVDVSLDASRRWVTLSHVSPEFASAVDSSRHTEPIHS